MMGLPNAKKSSTIRNLVRMNNDEEDETNKLNIIVLQDPNCVNHHELKAMASDPYKNIVSVQESLMDQQFESTKYLKENANKNTDLIIEQTPLEMIQFYNLAFRNTGILSDFNFERLTKKMKELTRLKMKNKEWEKYEDTYVFIDRKPDEVRIIYKYTGISSIYEDVYWHMQNFLSTQMRVIELKEEFNKVEELQSKIAKILANDEDEE